jgi:hypothetical protein
MAKVKTHNNTGEQTRTYVEWAYENLDFVKYVPNPHYEDLDAPTRWITEDDELSASYKAVGLYGTGLIASRQVTEVTDRNFDYSQITAEAWTVKSQGLIRPRS